MRKLEEAGLLKGKMLDFGCGKGIDADTYGMDKYDLHYNRVTLVDGIYDTITCNYVLNVIESNKERLAIQLAFDCLLKKGGIAYITVRRDIKTEGYTKRGTYQENIVLDLPILWETAGCCTYIQRSEK